MKKLVYVCLVLGLCSCTNMGPDLSNIFEEIKTNQSEMMPELKTEKIELTAYDPERILDGISSRLKNGDIREYNGSYRKSYEGYVGDYISIPLNVGENTYNMVKYPNGVQYTLQMKDGKLLFRSLYQGTYEIMLYAGGAFSRKIVIDNKMYYQFTEQNNYDIISQCYSQANLKGLNDSVAIHRIAFPNSFRDKELSFLLIDLASKDGNTKIMKDEINFLQKSATLTDYDKMQLIRALQMMKDTDYDMPDELLKYDVQSTPLNMQVAKILSEKKELSSNEILFLERVYKNNEDGKYLGKIIGDWYVSNGNLLKGNEYIKEAQQIPEFNTSFGNPFQTSTPIMTPEEKNYREFKNLYDEGKSNFNRENYGEAIIYFEKALGMNKSYSEEKDVYYYLGQSYFGTGDYSKAVIELKKSLNLEKNDEKKAEIYYNIGMLYEKLGDKEQAANYFTYVIQNYKNSPWGVKSSVHILQQ